MNILVPLLKQKDILFNNEAAKYICDNGNRIPKDPHELRQVRGIGAKLSECVLAYAFGRPALPVDGNVLRLLYRVCDKDPAAATASDYDTIRSKLKDTLKEGAWINTHELFRLHATAMCKTVNAQCHLCPLASCQSRRTRYESATTTAKARQEARRIIDGQWELWRRLICDL